MKSVDLLWVVVASALVMSMQVGFCMLESGLVRSKNTINVALKNFLDFCVAGLFFWACAFGVMFGTSRWGLIGTSDFLFQPVEEPGSRLAFFLFQLMFCATAATIVSGAVAERMKFGGYLLVTAICSGVIYPIYGHWAWAEGGWLREMGFIDFAGSSVVHGIGGWTALAAAIVIGPRLGRFTSRQALSSSHSLGISTFGTLTLFVAWIGFNGGSTLAIDDTVPLIVVNTILAGCAGGLSGLAVTWWRDKLPMLPPTLNGCIAGLVAITACCHAVTTGEAVFIGAAAGVLTYFAGHWVERARIDDVVGAWSAHGASGAWGTIAAGLFGDRTILNTGLSLWQQTGVQALGVLVSIAWAGVIGYGLFRLLDFVIPLRIDAEGENVGLNVSEHGASTEIIDLLTEMARHSSEGDFTSRIVAQPFSEMGQIAAGYNRVVDKVVAEMEMRDHVARRLDLERETTEATNQKLLSSIEYAQRIQHAVLPNLDSLAAVAADHFVLYLPRDIVSGDFYWCDQVGDSVFCIVADCTGHGVPGAFMSMLGNSLLHQIIREQEIASPAEILQNLHRRVRTCLGQDHADNINQDGMDIVVLRIDRNEVVFSGARRPLWFRTNGQIHEIRGDRISIGGGRHEPENATFSEHRLKREATLDLYLFSDGLPDQPNHAREPFDTVRLRQLLLDFAKKPMAAQNMLLQEELEKFRGGAAQRDDITLIGLRCPGLN